MQTARYEWRRRTTAAALKQQMAAWLEASLPGGWTCQLLPSGGGGGEAPQGLRA